MKTVIASVLFALSLGAHASPELFRNKQTDSLAFDKSAPIDRLEERLDEAETLATPEGLAVLQKSRSMIANGDVVVGSCWDFINAVFERAGFPSKQRVTVHKGRYAGPYAEKLDIQPGDWLYFINHSYNDVEHSGIFIGWMDESQKEALVSSYAGGNKPVPGRYRVYDLTHVFNVIRGKF